MERPRETRAWEITFRSLDGVEFKRVIWGRHLLFAGQAVQEAWQWLFAQPGGRRRIWVAEWRQLVWGCAEPTGRRWRLKRWWWRRRR